MQHVAQPETATAAPAPTFPLVLKALEFSALAQTPQVPQMAIYSDVADLDFSARCTQLQAPRPQELAGLWPHVVSRIVLHDCRDHRLAAEGNIDSEPFVVYQVSTAFKPGTVTLHSLSMTASRYELSELHASYRYVLDVPLELALKALRPQIERNCQPMLENPAFNTDCVMQLQEDDVWSVSVGELNSYNMLQRDPDDANRSIYSEGGGD